MLKIGEAAWQYVAISAGLELGPVEILFERIDKKAIQDEETNMKRQ